MGGNQYLRDIGGQLRPLNARSFGRTNPTVQDINQ